MSEILDNYKALAAERGWSDDILGAYLDGLPAADIAAELRAAAGVSVTAAPVDRSASAPTETAAAAPADAPAETPVAPIPPAADSSTAPSINL